MSLRATLDATIGEDAVEFHFAVANDGDAPVELQFPSGQVADVAVSPDGSDEPVWRWSDDRLFTQAIEREVLDPDEALQRTYSWPDPGSGRYVAVASLAGEQSAEATTSIDV